MAKKTTLRSLRRGAGLTQKALAQRCRDLGEPIPQSRISDYERGHTPPTEKIPVLAAALGVKPERLFTVLIAQKAAA